MRQCLSCQYEAAKAATGQWPTPNAAAHWAMWGCTCSPASETEAIRYIDIVSR